ncbi:exodeoxyribonuclease VII large subunit [Rhodosalinus sp. FB01]|uniref:exodeoxyribonuclease VII large subunit n=1 Tax=Rhodosalinus sp. FB01 TaxID=3239194 RepID=UPI003524C064
MSDLIEDDGPGAGPRGNAPEFTVSELSGAVKRVVEGEFPHVRVRGEVGRVSRPRSGHVYLDLKDERAVLSGVIWKGAAARLATQPEEGLEVVATGRLTTFPGQSRYQIVIEDIRPAGQGALMALLEQRKKQLAAEGLFDEARKRRLPYLPEVIGVVTSPSGAVIRDILHRLRDRFPRHVLIWPVAVQGERCAPEVANAIRGFNALPRRGPIPRPDLLIVARGGGSIEDLWGFNEEIVARAAAASGIPLVSAVGHETDTTLIDFVSDRRAPTPTAAAELAVPVRLDLVVWLDGQGGRLTHALTAGLARRGERLRDLGRGLPRPETLVEYPRQRLDTLSDRLPAALSHGVQARRVTLSEAAGSLRPALLASRLDFRRDAFAALGPRLAPALARLVAARREALGRRADRLDLRPVRDDLARRREALDRVARRLSEAGAAGIAARRERLAALDRLRETLGYRATLERGYAVVRGDGAVVTRKAAAEAVSALEIEFADGRLRLGQGPKRGGGSKASDPPPEQGSLF